MLGRIQEDRTTAFTSEPVSYPPSPYSVRPPSSLSASHSRPPHREYSLPLPGPSTRSNNPSITPRTTLLSLPRTLPLPSPHGTPRSALRTDPDQGHVWTSRTERRGCGSGHEDYGALLGSVGRFEGEDDGGAVRVYCSRLRCCCCRCCINRFVSMSGSKRRVTDDLSLDDSHTILSTFQAPLLRTPHTRYPCDDSRSEERRLGLRRDPSTMPPSSPFREIDNGGMRSDPICRHIRFSSSDRYGERGRGTYCPTRRPIEVSIESASGNRFPSQYDHYHQSIQHQYQAATRGGGERD
jgi:hypothetical protein